MILTTTPTIEGHPVRHYLGVVTSETIIGANVFRDFMATFAISSAAALMPTKKYYAKQRILHYKNFLRVHKPLARML